MDRGLPDSIDILGIRYSVEYLEKPSDVDIHKRSALWGQVDFWTRSIRIYDDGGRRPVEDIWHTILHEVIHAICSALKIEDEDEEDTDLLALGLLNVLSTNKWMAVSEPDEIDLSLLTKEIDGAGSSQCRTG